MTLVAHADWSVAPQKRWMAVAAAPEWRVRVEKVGPVDTLLARLRDEAAGEPVLFGVDAPIGLPAAYASRHGGGCGDFPKFLAGLAADSPFFSVCDEIAQVGADRPFFPRTTRAAPRRHDQAIRLGVPHHDDLLRRCDRKTPDRPRAACLFWTLGPNQVGKAALSLWREVLHPALHATQRPALWPFDGDLHALLRTHDVTIAETYPAEALRRLAPAWRGSKRRQSDRAALAPTLMARMAAVGAEPEPALRTAIVDGFTARPDGEDRFDCLVGLLFMLAVLPDPALAAAPADPAIVWEGWILGQRDSVASF